MSTVNSTNLFEIVSQYFPEITDHIIIDVFIHLPKNAAPCITIKFIPKEDEAVTLVKMLSKEYRLVEKTDMRQLMDEADEAPDTE